MNDKNGTVVSEDGLFSFARDIFAAAGVGAAHAALWAEVLVWANLRGVDTHGVMRIPIYLGRVANGAINGNPDMRVERRDGATAVTDVNLAPGPVGMMFAMNEAIARAREVRVGWCVVRNVTHAGAVGYYALKAAEAGMVGMAMTASLPMMAYPGATARAASTNPLAIAVPGGDHAPLVLDFSTATATMGQIMRARDMGTSIPEGWALDEAGRVTTDPGAARILLPLGGPKGSGLSLMIECLSSLAAGNPLIAPALNPGPGSGAAGSRPNNGLVVAVDIAAFGDAAAFRRDADALATAITSLPRAEGVDRLYMPGERGDTVAAQRAADGIPVPQGTWNRLAEVAGGLGVAMPETKTR